MNAAPKITQAAIDSGTITKTGLFKFVTDASEIGLRPGAVPRSIETTIGNGLPFILTDRSPQIFKYRQDCGCIELDVYNE